MKKIAVIYASRYGYTQKYAQWLAEALQADLLERPKVTASQLSGYDIVVYGGGLYAGGIAGVRLVADNLPKQLVVFTVGIADPKTTDYTYLLNKNFESRVLDKIKVFHLRGGIDYNRLGAVHKVMMGALKRFMLDRKPSAERTEEEQMMVDTYGGAVDFTDKASIQPIIDYVKGIN